MVIQYIVGEFLFVEKKPYAISLFIKMLLIPTNCLCSRNEMKNVCSLICCYLFKRFGYWAQIMFDLEAMYIEIVIGFICYNNV